MSQDKIVFEKWFARHEGLSEYSANEAWEAATAEHDKRVKELEARHERDIAEYTAMREVNAELQASNNTLREALKSLLAANKITHSASTPETVMQAELQMDKIRNAVTKANEAISSTPAESLQAFENEVIEKCAKVCDEWIGQEPLAEAIRALKEVK